MKRPAILNSPAFHYPAAKGQKEQSFFSTWLGCLFLLESIAIGVAVFGVPDPLFIVGATAFNFFVAAPVAALGYAIFIKAFWK